MYFNLTKLLLVNVMMIGVIMTICSNNWMSMWIGMEISLISFIPLIQNKNSLSSESMIKYFIIQSSSSTLFLFSIVYMLIGVNLFNKSLLLVSILIKIGSSPFHNWVIMVVEFMDFMSMIYLFTVLKMPPLYILYLVNSKFMLFPMIMSFLTSILCINQSSTPKILGYSSIFNMGSLMTTINNLKIMIVYIMIYSIMLTSILILLMNLKIKFINQMIFSEFNSWIKMNVWISMLSLSGFPPLLGFINKMLILQNLAKFNLMNLMFILLLTSMLINLFYIRMTFSSMFKLFLFKKWTYPYSSKMISVMLFINLFSPTMMLVIIM
nr:NADH dehydrogenase subunit 2 [Nelidina sp. n.]